MKYAVFTYYGYGLAIAKKLINEGQEVVVGQVDDYRRISSTFQKNVRRPSKISTDRRMSLFDGLVPKKPAEELLAKLKKEKSPQDWFVFLDLNHMFQFARELQDLGFHGNFPTEDDFCYELDRERAKNLVDAEYAKLGVAAKRRFRRAADARSFLKNDENIWVLKGLAEDARTVVPDVTDVEMAHRQILTALEQFPDDYESSGFLLELLIPDVREITPQKVYYNGEPVYTCICIENKPMGSGNLGPMTDCAQDLVFRTEFEDRINAIAFPPYVDDMAKAHKGLFYWDASLYFDPKSGKAYFGEFCANRPGYNSLYTELALCGSASRYFEAVVAGKNPHPPNQVAASARIFNFHRDASGWPLRGGVIDFAERAAGDLWLWDARSERGKVATAGYVDSIGVMTSRGHSVREAAARVYKHLDEFSFEGAYYRPSFDYLSRDYGSSIVNRLNYGLERGLYKVGFGVE